MTVDRQKFSASRLIHWVSFAAILVAAIVTGFAWPSLWTGDFAFGTISGFLTLYGVVFAVIETGRSRSASEQAKAAAVAASQKADTLFGIRGVAECQSCITFTLKDLEKHGWVSTSALSRIIELYTAQFHKAYEDPTSTHRLAIGALQSHAASASPQMSPAAMKRLKKTLVEMLAAVTAAGSAKISETNS